MRVWLECNAFEHNVDINRVDDRGETVLFLAVKRRSGEIVSLLLDNKAAVNAVNHEGKTALVEAVLRGNIELAALLLDKGAHGGKWAISDEYLAMGEGPLAAAYECLAQKRVGEQDWFLPNCVLYDFSV